MFHDGKRTRKGTHAADDALPESPSHNHLLVSNTTTYKRLHNRAASYSGRAEVIAGAIPNVRSQSGARETRRLEVFLAQLFAVR
jgi:hypothetical protein